MLGKYIFCVMLICGYTWAQSEPTLTDALASLPPELQNAVDEKQLEDVKNKSIEIAKEKCLKNGGPNAYEQAEAAFKTFPDCVKGLVDMTTLQNQIEAAKTNGTVDDVFKEYCNKREQFRGCFRSVADASQKCLSPEEKENIKIVHNVTAQLAEFICFKDGDRIALFISENGPECFQQNEKPLSECFNKTLGTTYEFNGNLSLTSLPNISFQKKECGQLTELQTCVVKVLDTCDAPTTGNIVDSLFKFIREATPCKNFDTRAGGTGKNDKTKSGVSGLAVTSATLISAIITVLLF